MYINDNFDMHITLKNKFCLRIFLFEKKKKYLKVIRDLQRNLSQFTIIDLYQNFVPNKNHTIYNVKGNSIIKLFSNVAPKNF